MKRTNVILVYDEKFENILMCHRRKEPYKGLLNLVGGKVEEHETSLAAAYRELNEETGLSEEHLHLTHLMDFTYYLDDIVVEVYVGRLHDRVDVYGEENELFWINRNENFFDMSRFAGEGNIGHMLRAVEDYHMEVVK